MPETFNAGQMNRATAGHSPNNTKCLVELESKAKKEQIITVNQDVIKSEILQLTIVKNENSNMGNDQGATYSLKSKQNIWRWALE